MEGQMEITTFLGFVKLFPGNCRVLAFPTDLGNNYGNIHDVGEFGK